MSKMIPKDPYRKNDEVQRVMRDPLVQAIIEAMPPEQKEVLRARLEGFAEKVTGVLRNAVAAKTKSDSENKG